MNKAYQPLRQRKDMRTICHDACNQSNLVLKTNKNIQLWRVSNPRLTARTGVPGVEACQGCGGRRDWGRSWRRDRPALAPILVHFLAA